VEQLLKGAQLTVQISQGRVASERVVEVITKIEVGLLYLRYSVIYMHIVGH